MSKCELKISLDDGKTHYKPGDEISGRVQVQVQKDCKCDDLQLSFGWQTHGRGNRTGRDVHRESLFKGEWPAGSQHSYPFRLTVPYGPATYHGHFLNVDWLVHAEADVPWKIDPKAEQDIILDVSEGGQGTYNPGPYFKSSSARRGSDSGGIATYIVLLIFALGGGAFYYFNPSDESLWIAIGIASIASLIGLYVIIKRLLNASARKKLGNVSVKLEPPDPQPGQRLKATLMLQPPKKLKLKGVTWTLYAEETVISGSGTRETTHRKTVFSQTVESLSHTEEISAQQSRTFIANFALAKDAPCSFAAIDNKLEWTLKLHVDIPLAPDWRKSYPLSVLPKSTAQDWQDDDDDYDDRDDAYGD